MTKIIKDVRKETTEQHPRRIEMQKMGVKLMHVVHKNWARNMRWSLEKYSDGSIILWRKRMGKHDTVIREAPLMYDCSDIEWDFGYISDDGKSYRWLEFNSNYDYPDEPELPFIGGGAGVHI